MYTETTHTEKNINGINELLKYSKLFSNEFHVRDILKDIELYKEINNFYPCEIVARISIMNKENKDFFYYNHSTIFLNHHELKLNIKHWGKNYMIFDNFSHMYPDIRINNTETEPNKIGVLSTKKIESWIKYYEKVNLLYKEESEKADNKIKLFKSKLIGLNINWDKGTDKSGYIQGNGIRYTFKIHLNGYIDQRIEITDSINLETFLKLNK